MITYPSRTGSGGNSVHQRFFCSGDLSEGISVLLLLRLISSVTIRHLNVPLDSYDNVCEDIHASKAEGAPEEL